jgi:hypothetical protein
LLCKISPYSVLDEDSNVISLATASPNIFLSEFLGMSQEGGPHDKEVSFFANRWV